MAGKAYAGQRRRKQTPWSVKFGDALVSRIIAVGGIGTIVAILLVVFVLVATAFPLLNSPSFDQWKTLEVPTYAEVGVDADGVLLWGLKESGDIEVRDTLSGSMIDSYEQVFEGEVTAHFVSIDRKTIGLGFQDGSVRVASIAYEDQLISLSELPAEGLVSESNPIAIDNGTVYQWFDVTSARTTRLGAIEWTDAYKLSDAPVLALDFIPDSSANRFATSATDRCIAVCGTSLVKCEIVKKKRLGRVSETVEIAECPLTSRSPDGKPLGVMALNSLSQAVVVWPNGTLDRYSIGDGEPVYRESQTAMVGGDLTCTAPLVARQTVLCGTAEGQLHGWSIVRQLDDAPIHSDGLVLSMTHRCEVSSSPLVALTSSSQSHVAVAADTEGQASLVYVTNNTFLGSEQTPLGDGIRSVCVGPDGNMLVAASDERLVLASFDSGHPEASVRGYFGKVWYEAHDEPKYIWQSSAATEEAEIKLSLMPLIFGTMKATVYAMLISVPLAILAAIYTSEFLSSAMRTRVKPIIELMASLPSVVLGYVAALVVAPYLEQYLITVLTALLVIPMSFVLGGHLWGLLPVDRMVRMQAYRLPLMAICLPLGCIAAFYIGQTAEVLLFGGNLVAWLGGEGASPIGGWMLLLIPALAISAIILTAGPLAPWIRQFSAKTSPRTFAIFAILRFLLTSAAVVCVAWLCAAALSQFGLDLRGSLIDNYQDKNALLVGGALGFCVIPIIYTISDDALQAVPRQLRSASLGCGATPWQTAIRVVVPSAMSGLFSAVMVGLGRAVGETMVVLCAAGNTPLMEWNVFNGFKTLSAALATELPEAAKGSTHFRTLFLAALVLFVLTLVANTLAEFVRIRFRKRASQL